MTTDSNTSDPGDADDSEPGTERRGPEGSASTARAPAPPRPRGGRLLAGLSLLVALAALGGAGYLYYELIHRSEAAALAGEVDALRADLAAVDQRFAQLAESQQAELEQFRERQQAARAATERALRESLNEVARQAPPSTGEWQRAEAQYLLRIANHRLLMERDVEGTLRLLEAADTVLAELDDFALHEVRARLADEIASLESVDGTDVQGLFLRLEAAKRNLDELPLRLPEYLKPEPAPPPAGEDVWSLLQHQLSGMLNIRHLNDEVKPLLGPEEGLYLELNLRLMLERAQLAAVRREQLIFEESITTALEWIHRYLDADKAPVRRLQNELAALREVDLAQPLPDVSGSLNALGEALRNPA
jgi:uroporphyrin-III C-methyltransferase